MGDVLGKYHPHGDSSVYDALVRMVQDFSLRYPLVDGQGNFGSVDGDSAAAYRYTEARLTRIAMAMLEDIDKNTVDFQPNFDDRLQEPTVLPSKIPNLLVNGSSGIAVGMATNIPPHNLREVAKAVELLVDNPDATIADLRKVIKGPDFPTGGYIYGREGIKEAYETGRGRVIMRARAQIEEKESSDRSPDRHHRDPLPGQQGEPGPVHRRAGHGEEDRGHHRASATSPTATACASWWSSSATASPTWC